MTAFSPAQAKALAWILLTGRGPRVQARALYDALRPHWRWPPFGLGPAEVVTAPALAVARHHPMTRAVRAMQSQGFVVDDVNLMCRRHYPTCSRIPMLRPGRAQGETPADNMALVDHAGRVYRRGRFITLHELLKEGIKK